ncbi:hypothetical protein HanPI659440_Chr02g0083511 [Helianthus annuus]|nr:hypothetical protein HanPI659440_Chr02g0083511 [Helianthus annuus]
MLFLKCLLRVNFLKCFMCLYLLLFRTYVFPKTFYSFILKLKPLVIHKQADFTKIGVKPTIW